MLRVSMCLVTSLVLSMLVLAGYALDKNVIYTLT
jgi:hypothetical protein